MGIKLNGKAISFYVYTRQTMGSSGEHVSMLMEELQTNKLTKENNYFRTKNFYIQLLAAFSAPYWNYPFKAGLIPIESLRDCLKEMIAGRKDGIQGWTFDGEPIVEELVEKFNKFFTRYYDGYIIDNEANIVTAVFNPDINEFTRRFLQDTVYLMETESHISMDEIQRTMLAHHIADIPLMVFETLDDLDIQLSD